MKLTKVLLLASFLLGCDRNEQDKKTRLFESFVFSFSAEDSAYSLKFTNTDTVFFLKSFPSPGGIYIGTIQEKDKNILDSLIKSKDLSKYDTTYIQNNLQDGISYKFYLTQGKFVNWVYIYGDEGPKELYAFAKWLTDLTEHLKLYPFNGKADFGDLKYIALPIVPPPQKG